MAPPKVRREFSLISFGLATVFSAALFYYGLQMTLSQMHRGQITAGLQWPEWIFGSFVPIGAFFITLEFLFLFLDAFRDNGEEVAK